MTSKSSKVVTFAMVCPPVVLITVLSTCIVPVDTIVPPVIPFVVATDVTPLTVLTGA